MFSLKLTKVAYLIQDVVSPHFGDKRMELTAEITGYTV
jgi:hypothetical protein